MQETLNNFQHVFSLRYVTAITKISMRRKQEHVCVDQQHNHNHSNYHCCLLYTPNSGNCLKTCFTAKPSPRSHQSNLQLQNHRCLCSHFVCIFAICLILRRMNHNWQYTIQEIQKVMEFWLNKSIIETKSLSELLCLNAHSNL